MRDTGAEEIGADVPKLQDIRRVSWGQLGMAVGLLVGVYLVAQQFAGINDLWATLQTASWEWVVVTFVLAQATNLSQTESMIGSVASPLPFGPSLGVQLANAYTGLVAGTLGTTATIIRYFQRRGLAVSVAVSSGVLVTVATMVTQVLLFTVSFIASYGDFNLDTSGSSGSSGGSSGAVTIIVLIVAAVLVGVVAPGVPAPAPPPGHQQAPAPGHPGPPEPRTTCAARRPIWSGSSAGRRSRRSCSP